MRRQGPSRQPRWHKYEIEGLGEVWGFTVDRVPELAPVKQEELAADHDPPARPFASPPVHPQLDRCPPCCACRLPHAPARTVRVRSIRLSARRRGVKHEARSENVVMPKFRPRKRRRRRRRRRGRRCVLRLDAPPASCARHSYPRRRRPVRRLLIRPVRLAQDARKRAEEKEAKAKAKAEEKKATATAKAVR